MTKGGATAHSMKTACRRSLYEYHSWTDWRMDFDRRHALCGDAFD